MTLQITFKLTLYTWLSQNPYDFTSFINICQSMSEPPFIRYNDTNKD